MGALQLWNGPIASRQCYCDLNEALPKDNEISQQRMLGGQAVRFSWDEHNGKIVVEQAN